MCPPPNQRPLWTLHLALTGWEECNILDKILAIVLLTSIVIAAVSLACTVAMPLPDRQFTELDIRGPGGHA